MLVKILISDLSNMKIIVCIMGLMMGIILGRIYRPKNIYRGPNSKDVKNRIYKHKKTGKCSKLIPRVYINTMTTT